MIALLGYQIIAKIYESPNSLVYRGIREEDNQPVILKFLKDDYPTLEQTIRYKQEYKITHNLNLKGVIKAYSLEKYQNSLVIIFEDFGGESLKILMDNKTFNLKEFLFIAIKTSKILSEIHRCHIIHKDINPSNIVFNPNTKKLKLIDFGISSILSRENPTLKNPNILEGTLAYISPEQTGRMNRSLDYRTDFYSLGATFYELLTHQLPFDATDAMELVHCHLAKQPIPLHELNPEIPQAVSNIVRKLLAKTAEERYQSAWGIKADLEECLFQWQTNNQIVYFPLGRHDISDKFQIPQKLYGREAEVETILAAFERVAGSSELEEPTQNSKLKTQNFRSEMMLVSGYSGIGKSALVQEIYKPLTRRRGYFISGKFDQFQRNIPYLAIVSAFSNLVRQLLTETEASLAQWREKLLAAFGANGQVIIDVIPEVELIVGKQPEVPDLAPAEFQNRFNLVFQNFIRVFTQPEHPLVVFIDDLQWADAASLKLIKLLMTAPDSQYLFLMGAYRDNEVRAAHPLIVTVDDIRKAGVMVHQISLSPLDLFNVNQLISDTLKCPSYQTVSLAKLVLYKTGGNPFFLNEFLKSLYAEKLLEFDREQGCWKWNIEQIKARDITDNVVELMASKIQKLGASTQRVLQLAATIGNQFDLQTLASVLGKSNQKTVFYLHKAVSENLVLPLSDAYKSIEEEEELNSKFKTKNSYEPNFKASISIEYKFAHDRIQQAAYFLLPPDEKQAIHWKIGQVLLQNTPQQLREQKIFDVVNHLNLGIDLIAVQSERNRLAKLNLMAGKKAKASAAYEPAWNYLKIAMDCLSVDSWQMQYNLTLELYVEATEAASLSGNFQEMERLTSVVQQQARTLLDKVSVYEVKIQGCTAHNKPLEAIKTALSVLKLLGIHFPKKPTKLDILFELVKTKISLFGKQIEDLINLPVMTAPDKLAAMRILSSVVSAAYFAMPDLLPLLVLKQVNLSIKYGNTSVSSYAYATYGLILCGEIVGDVETGYQFGQLALRLLDKFNAKELKARTLLIVNYFIKHWKEHLRETLSPLLDAYLIGLETGDLEYGAYSACVYSYHSYVLGKELPKVEREMAMYGNTLRQLGQDTAYYYNQLNRQLVLNLMDRAEDKCRLIGESYDEIKMLPLHVEAKAQNICHSLYFYKLVLGYLFQDYEQARENAKLVEKSLDSAVGTIPLSHFYNSLVHLAIYSGVPKPEQKKFLLKVKANQKHVKKWAQWAPMTHLHKFYLVEAERYRVLDRQDKAMDYYDRAIELAKQHEYINDEALAHELAAKFYLGLGKVKIARVYMLDALYCYREWGAIAKVKDLEARYPKLLFRKSDNGAIARLGTSATRTGKHNTRTSTDPSITSSGSSEALDLATVMKAGQAISSEMMLDKLLAKLMKILIENAGAQKGFLILEQAGKLLIEASGVVDRDKVTVFQSIPLESTGIQGTTPLLSSAIINYVARTFESVVLNDATREGQFTKDPYIIQNQPKSILCVPLINQGKLISIVYLENNLATEAFTPDRLKVLQLLSAQAAIAIENAKLYSEVTESGKKLTQFLEAMPIGVSVLDASGKPYYRNRISQQLVNQGVFPDNPTESADEVSQTYIAGTNQPYPTEQLPSVRALRGESTTADNLEIRQGDKVIPLEARGTPILDEKGNVAYAIVAFQDITERKRAEAERLNFTEELFQLNQAFSHFVPRQFLHLLEKESIVDVKLGDQVQKEMSVLFSDIRDFTTLSESMAPEDNFKFINAYLSRMEPMIIAHQGFIDKFIGDAIMALFSGSADDAVQAGIAMLHQLTEYNQHRANSGYVPIQIGIGINTGSLMLGTVGGQNRMDTTVISDTVNLASRVEGLTKNYRVSLLISHHTFSQLEDVNQYAFRLIDRVQVKGKSAAVSVYEIFDADPPQIKERKLITKTAFEEALLLYNLRSVSEAAKLFEEVLNLNPDDTVAQIYLYRCQGIKSLSSTAYTSTNESNSPTDRFSFLIKSLMTAADMPDTPPPKTG
jgi:predicted ATPase/class 3 adenylate cyclase/GAF domain-containing protein/tRNA A-37 threonylcarbamoyl transferase component Bud32